MRSENEAKVIKAPIARSPEEGFAEYDYQDNIVYYVRLSNGVVVTKPEDFPNTDEESKQSICFEQEQGNLKDKAQTHE